MNNQDATTFPPDFQRILRAVNVRSVDDGRAFTDPRRRNAIRNLLADTPWQPLHDGPLSFVYHHPDLRVTDRVFLISCHIDSVYDRHFAEPLPTGEWIGTFDNSICNAVLVDLMRRPGALPRHALIAFTGDEEQEGRGAAETARFLRDGDEDLWRRLELTLVLDVTGVDYRRPSRHLTLENLFVERRPSPGQRLTFRTRRQLLTLLRAAWPDTPVTYVSHEKADPDETWNYDEFDLNIALLGLPTAPAPGVRAGDWMHHRKGIRVRPPTVGGYSTALAQLARHLADKIT